MFYEIGPWSSAGSWALPSAGTLTCRSSPGRPVRKSAADFRRCRRRGFAATSRPTTTTVGRCAPPAAARVAASGFGPAGGARSGKSGKDLDGAEPFWEDPDRCRSGFREGWASWLRASAARAGAVCSVGWRRPQSLPPPTCPPPSCPGWPSTGLKRCPEVN